MDNNGQSNAVAVSTIKARLPMPTGMTTIDAGTWRVLCESIFPSARSAEAVVMAVDYCRARKLDILKKPVHIVPMWSSSLGREVETVWPSIGEVQTTAARTGQYAGMDEPKFGPMVKRKLEGIDKSGNKLSIELSYPEWCAVTVYRMIDGQRCAFTEPVYWTEAYGRVKKSEYPNDQWGKRPMGMIIKVAKAFSLRAAFPEEGFHTAEEMEGHVLEETDSIGVVIDNTEPLKAKSVFKNAGLRKTACENAIESFKAAKTISELNEIFKLNLPKMADMRDSGNEHDALGAEEIHKQYKLKLAMLKEADPDDEEKVPAFLREQMADEAERNSTMGAP